ncbi:hypothetical protein CBR_g29784 [Chara braunii]|uniref:Uncharacterized protein n=1 Tax=Chara braunii TaxID=69332 RepID=A0A388LBD5_CHABU|nr:hypothetical protein CBR_g29784 [Chara braunii]|eukprot:GBG79635.1 hypothetical protein CBR_g29784 [Chara braunii]
MVASDSEPDHRDLPTGEEEEEVGTEGKVTKEDGTGQIKGDGTIMVVEAGITGMEEVRADETMETEEDEDGTMQTEEETGMEMVGTTEGDGTTEVEDNGGDQSVTIVAFSAISLVNAMRHVRTTKDSKGLWLIRSIKDLRRWKQRAAPVPKLRY